MRVWWGFKNAGDGIGFVLQAEFQRVGQGATKAFLVRGFDTFSIQKV